MHLLVSISNFCYFRPSTETDNGIVDICSPLENLFISNSRIRSQLINSLKGLDDYCYKSVTIHECNTGWRRMPFTRLLWTGTRLLCWKKKVYTKCVPEVCSSNRTCIPLLIETVIVVQNDDIAVTVLSRKETFKFRRITKITTGLGPGSLSSPLLRDGAVVPTDALPSPVSPSLSPSYRCRSVTFDRWWSSWLDEDFWTWRLRVRVLPPPADFPTRQPSVVRGLLLKNDALCYFIDKGTGRWKIRPGN